MEMAFPEVTCYKVPRQRDTALSESLNNPDAFFWILEAENANPEALLCDSKSVNHYVNRKARSQDERRNRGGGTRAANAAMAARGLGAVAMGNSMMDNKDEDELGLLESKLQSVSQQLLLSCKESTGKQARSDSSCIELMDATGERPSNKRHQTGRQDLFSPLSITTADHNGLHSRWAHEEEASLCRSRQTLTALDACSPSTLCGAGRGTTPTPTSPVRSPPLPEAFVATEGFMKCGKSLSKMLWLLMKTKGDIGEATDAVGTQAAQFLLSPGAPMNALKHTVNVFQADVAALAALYPPSFLVSEE